MGCIDKLLNQSKEVHDYLRERAGKDYDSNTGEGKQEWIKAAKDLQEHSVKTINDIYSDLKIPGFEKSKTPITDKGIDKVGEVTEEEKKLLEPHKDSPVFMGMETDAQKLKYIADQSQNVNDKGEKDVSGHDMKPQMLRDFGEPLVKAAIEKYPAPKEETVPVVSDNNLNPNVALNMEFLGKDIGTAIIKKEDGYYYHVNGVEEKIPDQKRAEKAFNESKQSEKEALEKLKPVTNKEVPIVSDKEKFTPQLNDAGKPKIYYHTSDSDFNEFKGQDSEGYQRKHSVTNRGIYFHEAPPMVAKYGKNKYEVHLDIKNPFIIDNRTYVSDVTNPYTGKKIEVEHINADDIRFLKEQGYDAVSAKYPAFQTVVFEPSQVKVIKKNGEVIEHPKKGISELKKPESKPITNKEVQPSIENKNIGKYAAKAKEIADKIRNSDLPQWLVNTDPTIKKQGVSGESIKNAFADAIEHVGELLDKGVEFKDAIKEGANKIIDHILTDYPKGAKLKSDYENKIKNGFENYYKDNFKIEEKTDKNKPPKPPIDANNTTEDALDPEMTKMANAIVDAEVEGKFGIAALDKILSKLQDTDLKNIYEKVKIRIQKGIINVKDVRERLITTKQGSEEDQAVLMYDLADLKGKEIDLTQSINKAESGSSEQIDLQKKLMDVQNEMMDNALANRVLGRTGSTIFRLRQLWVNKEKSIVDMEEEYKASKGLKELTPEQQKEIKNAYDQMRELRAKKDAIKADLDKAIEANARLKEENDKLKKLKDKAAEQKKSDRKIKSEQVIAKSNERIQKAKDNLRELRGTLSAGFDPRVAIEVGKIAGEKFYQGIVKFDELVKNVLDDVKDIFPKWTEEDVVNHILTTTDRHGNVVPTLTSEKYIASKKILGRSNKDLQTKVKAYEQAQQEVALSQFQWQKDRRMDMMKSRPLGERLIDGVLRWQRFAVLSYPSTMVKLGAVVAHQLTLKPLKFLIQKFVAAPISKAIGISSKQNIWGDPKWSSLGKYYSSFIRNFALSNIKEQFRGIDTKEMLYGKPMVFDEWNAAKGLLEMPGRSHGYIKSFIKNPEFQFAHEQHITYSMGKMEEIQKQLDDPYLSEDKRDELKKEYDQNDVTNEDVMERINKLSLEHGKWAILMNDNKFVDKFRNWTKGNDIASALIKSELPIVKIPINYVGRAFATKYGLIKALTGSKWYKGNTPSILSIIFKGAENVTEEQANLLGKTLTIGSMGAAFFMLGYWQRKEVEVNEDGSINVGSTHLSKNLIHSPELESFFSGAETGNRFEKQKKKGKENWIASFAQSDADIAKKNPFANLLTYGFLPNVASTLLSTKNQDKTGQKVQDAVARKVGDMLIPGFVKQPAGWLDTKEKGIHPMNNVIPRNPKKTTEGLERFWEIIEKGIPGLRQNVPKYTPRQ